MELWSLQFSIAAFGKSKILFQNFVYIVTHQGSDVLRTNCVCLSPSPTHADSQGRPRPQPMCVCFRQQHGKLFIHAVNTVIR